MCLWWFRLACCPALVLVGIGWYYHGRHLDIYLQLQISLFFVKVIQISAQPTRLIANMRQLEVV